MQKVLYPGSFDPITFGHLNILERALELNPQIEGAERLRQAVERAGKRGAASR